MRLDDIDEALVRQVRTMVYLGRRHPRSPGYYRSAGEALLALQLDKPRRLWELIVREACSVGRRRAYELIELAKGKALDKLRAEGSARVRKLRKNRWLPTKPRPERVKKQGYRSKAVRYVPEPK